MTIWPGPGYLLALGRSLLENFSVVFGLAAFGYALGSTLTRPLHWEFHWEKVILATGLGFAVLGHLLLGLGLLGLLSPGPLAITLALLALICLPGWIEILRLPRLALRKRPAASILAAGALYLAPLLILPLYPPTGFDATMYHLPYARAFLSTGTLPFLASLRFPVFPQWTELLSALVMLPAGELAAQCLQTLLTLMTAGLLFVWGRRVFSVAAGALAAALYIGSPIVTYFSGTAYVEPALVFYSAAAVYSFSRWRSIGQPGWLAAAGVFAATAAVTKYLGLFWLVLLFAAALVVRLPGRRSRAAALVAATGILVLLPWYVRIAAHTGNPVFPYLPAVFGSSDWDLGSHQPRWEGAGALLEKAVSVARLPWDLVFGRERFGWHPLFSPFYLPGLLLALVMAARDARALRYTAIAAGFALFVSVAPQDPRYLMPAAALLALPIAAGIAKVVGRVLPVRARRPTLAAIALVLALPGWLYVLRHARRQGPVPVTTEQREAYLSRFLPAYPAIRELNRAHGDAYGVYAFFAENMPYFARGRFWGDWFGPASYEKVLRSAGAGGADALHGTLRGLGVTHLLVLESSRPPLPFSDGRFTTLFAPVYADRRARVFALTGPEDSLGPVTSARSSRTTSGPP